MHGNGGEVFRLGFTRPGKKPDVPEAKEGQLRMPGLPSVPADKPGLGLGAAVILVVPVASLVLHFGVVEQHFVPRVGVQGDFHIAGDLLAKVHHRVALGRFEYAFRGDALRFPDDFALLRNQDVLEWTDDWDDDWEDTSSTSNRK